MKRLKELRKLHNFRQKDIANKLNVSITGYASWEQGLAEPNIETLKKLSNIYQVSVDYIIDNEDDEGRIIVQELELPSDEKKLLSDYRNLPTDLKAIGREYFKSLNNINQNFNKNNKFIT